MGRVVHITFDF